MSLQVLIRIHKRKIEELQKRRVEMLNKRGELIRLSEIMTRSLYTEHLVTIQEPQTLIYMAAYRKKTENNINIMQNAAEDLQKQAELIDNEIIENYREMKKYDLVNQSKIELAKSKSAKKEQNFLDEIGGNIERYNSEI